MDPSTRELLDLTVERVAHLPVLLVVTFRPELQPPWTGQPHVTTLALSRLGRSDGASLVRGVAGAEILPDHVLDEIVERADGVPLFAEELTKAVVETGGGEAAGRGSAAGAPPAPAPPAALPPPPPAPPPP